jgi:hypothetical protein
MNGAIPQRVDVSQAVGSHANRRVTWAHAVCHDADVVQRSLALDGLDSRM